MVVGGLGSEGFLTSSEVVSLNPETAPLLQCMTDIERHPYPVRSVAAAASLQPGT